MANAPLPSPYILLVNSSLLKSGGTSLQLAEELIDKLYQGMEKPAIIRRDLVNGLPLITEDWIDANIEDPEARSAGQHKLLALSDKLVEELKAAELVVFSVPSLNYGVSALLKIWIDLICRKGLTYKQVGEGHVGLLEGKKAFVITDSGCCPIGLNKNFVVEYLSFVLNALGITDIETILTGPQLHKPNREAAARREIDKLAFDLETG